MFGKIINIGENIAQVETTANITQIPDLMNIHVIFEAPGQFVLGEVKNIQGNILEIRFLGEFIEGKYVNGVLRKPMLSSNIRVINSNELLEIVGTDGATTFKIGNSSLYKNFTVYSKINDLFANHMAIFGNSGSGKSWGVSRLIQNIFGNVKLFSYNANIFIFDAYGEYKTAFTKINEFNSNYSYKFMTTNVVEPTDCELHLPFHLLKVDDLALLLQADNHSQLPIIERSLRLCKIFSLNNEAINAYKNHLIAKALITILYNNETTINKKNQIYRVMKVCSTNEFSFDTVIQGLGYTRSFSECLEIDSRGQFGESVLITDYILKFVNDELEKTELPSETFYSIDDYSNALEFTLISDGFLDNVQLYDMAMMLKVRLNTVVNSKMNGILRFPNYIDEVAFINYLVANDGKKNQIINMNLEDLDDTYAKVLVKIFSRIFFDFLKTKVSRASMPIHLFLEEAHRYIQKDNDVFLLGYNIFERIAKEGRKYGILLNLISQRPVEISDTVISQCSNFLIFKMTHPLDIEYIEKMLPNISGDIIEKQKSLQPGNCVGFGTGFKIPMIIKMEKPNPTPNSNSCDVSNRWSGDKTAQ